MGLRIRAGTTGDMVINIGSTESRHMVPNFVILYSGLFRAAHVYLVLDPMSACFIFRLDL